MHKYPLLFSVEWKYRIQRHLLFWFSWWLFFTFLYSFHPAYDVRELVRVSFIKRMFFTSINALFFLPQHIFLAYALMYFVVPRFILTGKYIKAAFLTVILVLMTAALSVVTGNYIVTPFWRSVPFNSGIVVIYLAEGNFFKDLLAGLRGGITVGGFAAAIKLMKHLYEKDQRNMELQKQNISSQLQLLKAQIHPHFLFNTLNNIYSHTQVASPEAPMLVAGLSDLLRYMLYQCNQPLVPLRNELKMLQDYILLEQIRYNNQLDLSIDIPKNDGGLLIAPLLILPLVENSFKHGASQVLEHPWVSLTISVKDKQFYMKLVNGISNSVNNNPPGIGISNLEARLKLLYPERHQLRISRTDEAFIVALYLDLEKAPAKTVAEKPVAAYA